MVSKVYFADARARSEEDNLRNKVARLFDAADFGSLIEENDLTAIKLHFGESGCDAHIQPSHVRKVVEKIREKGGLPFVTDTNTLYKGSRHNSVDHIRTAVENGFDYGVIGCPVIIADGLKGMNVSLVEVNLKHIKTARIAGDIQQSDAMIVMTHFKAHMVAGFGGAVKNVAMGCSTAYGKMDQHSGRPKIVPDSCIACGACVEVCPEEALTIRDDHAHIDYSKCIGCGECMTVCRSEGIDLDWGSDIAPFNERVAEYALAALKGKRGKVGFINFVTRVSPDCDCVPWSDAPIVRDIGILASIDPVALDHACFDLVNAEKGLPGTMLTRNTGAGEDKFKGLRGKTDGIRQLAYGQEIGLGDLAYELVRI